MLKRSTIKLVLILVILSANFTYAKQAICPNKDYQTCGQYLRNYPLFDTEYKIAANYVPVIPLRALAEANVYKEKKSFHIERFFYVKNLKGDLGKAYQTIILDGNITGFGIFSRKIIAKGKLNEFDLEYENDMSFALPRTANMKVRAKLDGNLFLDLKITSDGNKMTNDVSGIFFGQDVKYHTDWRETNGILSGLNYKIYAEGILKDSNDFTVNMKGSIGKHSITGFGRMTSINHYESTEDYGPITVKSFITIKN